MLKWNWPWVFKAASIVATVVVAGAIAAYTLLTGDAPPVPPSTR